MKCIIVYGVMYVVHVCSYLYQIAHLGDDDDEPEFSSSMPLEEGDTFFFAPRMLKNLVMVDELDSLSPVMHCQVSVQQQHQQHRKSKVNITVTVQQYGEKYYMPGNERRENGKFYVC